ncbi:MAG: hypothetical protein AB1578_09930 [Thermodesulfobacteriota bacterium]
MGVGAVVIGGHINGLGVVRALAAQGIPVALVTTRPHDLAQYSRCASDHVPLRDLDEEPALLAELLEQRAGRWLGWAVFPTCDGALAALAQAPDRLWEAYRVVAPPPEVVRTLLDKEQMGRAAAAAGLLLPHDYGPAQQANPALGGVRFPAVVKPVCGHLFFARFGCKLFVAEGREELDVCLRRVAEAALPCRVADLVPGSDDTIYAHCIYVDARGEPGPGLTVHKLRQSPPGFGVARVAEVVPDPPGVREATIALLRGIGFRGLAAAEFKWDERDGTFRFLEVNGRSVIYNGLLRRAGLDLAGMAWMDRVEGRPQEVRPRGWPGVWVNLHADLLCSLLLRRRDPVGLKEFLAPYRRSVVDAVWSARDPGPFLAQWGRTLRDGSAAALRGGHRELLADRTRQAVSGR